MNDCAYCEYCFSCITVRPCVGCNAWSNWVPLGCFESEDEKLFDAVA